MLAQNFRTPTDLGISDAEFDALYKVLGMLERGEFETDEFDMRNPSCRTPCCILGHARRLGAFHHQSLGGMTPDRIELFAPTIDFSHYKYITPAQAAIALRNYLTTGEPRWAEALAE